MDKGITGARNVQALRDCEEANLTVSWNYLVGFPGEECQDYENIIAQIPNLHHLQPPSGANRIALERFSPYFDKPWLGFEERKPHACYPLTYDLSPSEIEEMAFFFETPRQGIDEQTHERLRRAIESWHEAYAVGRSLWHVDSGDEIRFVDSRQDTSREYRLRDPCTLAVFRRLNVARSRANLAGGRWDDPEVERALTELSALHLVFEDDGQLVRLSTESIPYRMADS